MLLRLPRAERSAYLARPSAAAGTDVAAAAGSDDSVRFAFRARQQDASLSQALADPQGQPFELVPLLYREF